ASVWSTLGVRRSASKGGSSAPPQSSRASEASVGIYFHCRVASHEEMKADPDAARGTTVPLPPHPSIHRWPSVERRSPTQQTPSPHSTSVDRRPPIQQTPNPIQTALPFSSPIPCHLKNVTLIAPSMYAQPSISMNPEASCWSVRGGSPGIGGASS